MRLKGYQRQFDCKNGGQYNAIGQFWEDMSDLFGKENLFGIGYGWHEDAICYLIGLNEGDIRSAHRQIETLYADAKYIEMELPECGWEAYEGETKNLSQMYDEIYRQGSLTYEIERFFENGTCRIEITRENIYKPDQKRAFVTKDISGESG